jgi:hypothetical protein
VICARDTGVLEFGRKMPFWEATDNKELDSCVEVDLKRREA